MKLEVQYDRLAAECGNVPWMVLDEAGEIIGDGWDAEDALKSAAAIVDEKCQKEAQ